MIYSLYPPFIRVCVSVTRRIFTSPRDQRRGTNLDQVVWENEVKKAHVEANIGMEKVGIRQHSGKVRSGLGASSF